MEMNIKFAEKINVAKEKVNENDALKDEFKAAVLELELIRNYINYVDDPDLIEYAIYAEKAIQKRIAYILKKLR